MIDETDELDNFLTDVKDWILSTSDAQTILMWGFRSIGVPDNAWNWDPETGKLSVTSPEGKVYLAWITPGAATPGNLNHNLNLISLWWTRHL